MPDTRASDRRPIELPTARSLGLATVGLLLTTAFALGDDRPPTVALPRPEASARIPAPARPRSVGTSSESGSGWWLGTVGIAAALAVFGGVSLASRRFLPDRSSGPIQVVGRSTLSAKHAVHLLRVGDRVLIVGTGPQGAPATLGEVTDPAELARLIPGRPAPRPTASIRPATRTTSTPTASTGFDRRIGDDE